MEAVSEAKDKFRKSGDVRRQFGSFPDEALRNLQ